MVTIKDAAMGLISSVLSLQEPSIGAKMLLIVLHCHTDSEEKCWLSDYEIARLMGMHPKSISRQLKDLVQRGLVKRIYDESRQRYLIPQTYKWEAPLETAGHGT